MFSELIAKKCLATQGCILHGQMQDKGLAICPECAANLTPVTRVLKNRILMVVGTLFILLLVMGTYGYAAMMLRLTASETLSWVGGRVTFPETVTVPQGRKPWFDGKIHWNFQGPRPAEVSADGTTKLICQRDGEEYYFHPRFQSSGGDQIYFDLSPREGYVYMFYKTGEIARALYPPTPEAPAPSPAANPIRVPADNNMKLTGGPSTETFVIVASRKAQPSLAELQTTDVPVAKLDGLARSLSADKENNLVMIVQVPHS